jgi:hypothetical protein
MPTIDSISVPNIINDENDISKGKENICNRYINSIIDSEEESDDGIMMIKNKAKKSNNKSKEKKVKNNNLEKHNLVWKKKFITPSIPYKSFTYGFVENEDGDIVPRKPPPNDDTIGPAYYNIKNNVTQSNNVYRGGFSFGNGVKERETFKINKDIPGPGQYNLIQNIDSYGIKKGNKVTALMKYAPNIRFSEAIYKQEIKKNLPGPGTYKVDVSLSNSSSKKKDLFLFGGKEERFQSINTLCNNQKNIKDKSIPGPGTYDIEQNFSEDDYLYKTISNGKNTLSKEDRFKECTKNQLTPGPGQYDIKIDYDPKIYHNAPSTKTYGFGATSKRFPTIENLPYPELNQYKDIDDSINKTFPIEKEKPVINYKSKLKYGVMANKNENESNKRSTNRTSKNTNSNTTNVPLKIGFGSKYNRFSKYGENGNPSPGIYDLGKAFDMLKSHGKIGLTLKERYDLNINNNRLPPGLYDLSLPEKKSFHSPMHDYTFMGKAERFKYKSNKSPGPGDYLSPHYDSSLIKKSFNITYKDKEILK